MNLNASAWHAFGLCQMCLENVSSKNPARMLVQIWCLGVMCECLISESRLSNNDHVTHRKNKIRNNKVGKKNDSR